MLEAVNLFSRIRVCNILQQAYRHVRCAQVQVSANCVVNFNCVLKTLKTVPTVSSLMVMTVGLHALTNTDRVKYAEN